MQKWYYRSRKTRKNLKYKYWTNREYHVQHNKDADNQEVKMYCATNQFRELQFIGTHTKPHGVCELGKNYHMHFYTKLGHRTCEINCIPCDCSLCTYILDQPWVTGLSAQKQPCYQPVQY